MAMERTVLKHSFNFCFLDLNTASEEEISSVPLIGATQARKLVEHRPYKSMEDVKSIPGILREQFHALLQAGAVVGLPQPELRA